MSVENGRVCFNCQHCLREWDGSDCRCRCDVSGDYLGYVRVMEGWCRHWAKEKENRRAET